MEKIQFAVQRFTCLISLRRLICSVEAFAVMRLQECKVFDQERAHKDCICILVCISLGTLLFEHNITRLWHFFSKWLGKNKFTGAPTHHTQELPSKLMPWQFWQTVFVLLLMPEEIWNSAVTESGECWHFLLELLLLLNAIPLTVDHTFTFSIISHKSICDAGEPIILNIIWHWKITNRQSIVC